ncbi:CHAT domain-containing protein [Lactarius quietus]|nr:CHAT domain-containing protein [Lactarius quietus]
MPLQLQSLDSPVTAQFLNFVISKPSIPDIDGRIASDQKSLSLLHRSHPDYINYLCILGETYNMRYMQSHQKDDLDKSILHCVKAIFLPAVSQDGPFPNIFLPFYCLARALLERSDKFEQSDGIKYCIEYFRFLRRSPLDSLYIRRDQVTTFLTTALCMQVKSGAGDGPLDIKEIIDICNELLASAFSKWEAFHTTVLQSLSHATNLEFHSHGLPSQLLDDVTQCFRDAVKMCPPGPHTVLFLLAKTLHSRFIKTRSIEDYEEAVSLLKRILDANDPGSVPDALRLRSSQLATILALARAHIFNQPEYFEASTSHLRTQVMSPVIGDMPRIGSASLLETHNRLRFDEYGLAESLEEANSHSSHLVNLTSSSSLAMSERPYVPDRLKKTYSAAEIQQQIEYLEKELSITPSGTQHHIQCLSHLEKWYESKFHRTNDISDIEESMKYSRLSLDATHIGSSWRYQRQDSLCKILFLAFEKTGNISYLDESIAVNYDILGLETAKQAHFSIYLTLVQSLLARERFLGRKEDYHEVIRLLSEGTNDPYVREPNQFTFSCLWAVHARRIKHPTTLTAYKSAMSLMQKSLSFAPTVEVQHSRLVAMGDCKTMPLEYASYQIDLGQFEEAIETLEQGRALLWSEMRSLRTPVAQLIEEDSPLAKRFAEVNQELESLTISITPSGKPEIGDAVAQGGDWMDPFGRLVVKQQKLVKERDALISQIQVLPGLEDVFGALSFTTLRSAASQGPVIIINHIFWRSDIVVIFSDSFHFISTPKNFYSRSNKLRDELVEARKRGLDSNEYQDALSSVLKGLYELVGAPVIERLRLAGVPEQSRIWWCPTSVFCSLPLHAMGPIPSGDGREQYFSDLYIPSYTPSLSALIESRRETLQMPGKPSLLLVAQPDDSLPGVKGEIKVIRKLEERATVIRLVSGEATPTSVVECLQGSRLAHFACHGVLEAGKPFDASFKLHGGSRLTLLEIVRSRLPDAEFAFLSCCHAAEITKDSVADEALHLTAAMQYCGFRSVVGTMWEMADTDGKDLSKSFYKSLFSSQETGTPYYERSARALRDATQKLRGKRGISLERWVNFVHYGA